MDTHGGNINQKKEAREGGVEGGSPIKIGGSPTPGVC